MELNGAQRRAVEHVKGPMLVLAGPGSGKTAVIAERSRRLVEKGVEARRILVVTFTKAASVEMKERFHSLCEASGMMSSQGYAPPVQFGTFHAVFFSILKAAYHYETKSIIHEEEKRQFFREMMVNYRFDFDDEKEFLSDLMGEISRVKGEMLDLSHYYSTNCSAEVFREIYEKYQEMLLSKRLLDFDDMLVYTYDLFRQRKDILAIWQAQFPYILIDEFQDINPVQYAIVRMLASPENNLFVVGDDDQSIYRFRGAKPEIMLNFERDYKQSKKVLLDVNYRCSPAVVNSSCRVIRHNKKRFEKKIISGREGGGPVYLKAFETPQIENQAIAKKLISYHNNGIPWECMAVLFRTNTQPRQLIETLMQFNIPFCIKDSLPNIYEHFIGQDIRNYIRIAQGNRERRLFLRLANRPKRYLSREVFDHPQVSFEALRLYYEDKKWMLDRIDEWEYDLRWLARLSPYAGIQYLRHKIGYDEFLREYAQFRRIREEDLFEVIDEIEEAAKPFSDYEAWFNHIDEYAKQLEEKSRQNQTEKYGVMLSTMHSAKGLEYTAVFLLDANEGVTPHRKAVLEADVEEERRMFYVAMTRAKDFLHISYVKKRYDQPVEPSRFVNELLGEQPKKKRNQQADHPGKG